MNLKPNVSTDGKFQNLGVGVIRYRLAIVLIWIGILKFTSYESEGIKPMAEHSPLLSHRARSKRKTAQYNFSTFFNNQKILILYPPISSGM